MPHSRLHTAVARLERAAQASTRPGQSADRALHHLLAKALLVRDPAIAQVQVADGDADEFLRIQEIVAWAEHRYEDAEAMAEKRRRPPAADDLDAQQRVRALLAAGTDDP